ncbi:MAG: hypothetical protein WDA07_00375 [Leucobacter sp.]
MDLLVDIAGWAGMVLLLGAYTLLTLKKLRGDGWRYQLMNLLGGLGLATNAYYNGAIPVAVLNICWFLIGVFGFITARKKRQTERSENAESPATSGDGAFVSNS